MPILLSLVIVLSHLSPAVTEKEEALVGTWNVIRCTSNTPTLAPTLVQETTVEALSSVYTFNTDGTFVRVSGFAESSEKGIWSFDPETGTLAMHYASEGMESHQYYSLTSLEETKMVWVLDLGQMGSFVLTLKRE